MVIGWKPARAFIFIPLVLLLFIVCAVARPNLAQAAQGNMNGAATQMPAFYERHQVTVNMKEQPDGASAALLAHNPSINKIYANADLDEPQPFAPVINAIQGEGFNPLWQQFLYKFNTGVTPVQFKSEAEVLAAAAAGQITLTPTDEVYRCSVVGPGPKPR